MAARYIGRENVRKRLEPLEGTPGRSTYRDGAATFELLHETITVRPPFGLAHEGEYGTVHVAPLLDALAREHEVGALLVRLGGFAVGVFHGERLVSSKVGQRNVHSRHRAGGSSANRFRRRREKQAHELAEAAGAAALGVLTPYRDRLDAVAFGGDRAAVRAALETDPRLRELAEKALPRFFDVPDPRRAVLERLPYQLYAAEVVSRP